MSVRQQRSHRSDQVPNWCKSCSDVVRTEADWGSQVVRTTQDSPLGFTVTLVRLPPGVQTMFTMYLKVVRKSFTPPFEVPFAAVFECQLATLPRTSCPGGE